MGGRKRGELTPQPLRQQLIELIQEACNAGARLEPACKEVSLSKRTYRRWYKDGQVQADLRPSSVRPEPISKLSEQEERQILDICNKNEYASLPPSQIVPSLLDKGIYIASESSFYRVLKRYNQLNRRGREKVVKKRSKPKSYKASKPNQIWSWDITYCASVIKGKFYYLYMFEDIYSRKIVGYEVHEQECGVKAAELIQRSMLREQCFNTPLVLHSDNGAPMKSFTMKAKLEELGVTPSLSRPSVSNDNPYSEALFRTLKYRPDWPSKGFTSLEETQDWVENFVQWYNNEHKHSKINYVTPQERHEERDNLILMKRKEVLESAKSEHPTRWSGEVRNCEPVGDVMLNPDNETDTEKDEKHVA